MKISAMSTLSVASAMQLTVANTQKDIVKLQRESVTGTFYDVGIELGVSTSQSLNFSRDSARLQALVDSNALAEERMDNSQLAMEQMSASAQNILDTFVGISGSGDSTSITVASNTALGELQNFMGYANTAVKGEYLFSGINTDAQTLSNTFVEDLQSDFDTAFSNYQTANGITDVTTMTATQMTDFLDDYTANFDWASWTNASDSAMSSRINTAETVDSSVSINKDGFKNLVLAAVIGAQLGDEQLPSATRAAVTARVTSLSGAAVSGVDNSRSQLGLSQSRVEKANDSMKAQKTIIDTQLSNLVGVDKYEASTKLTTLMTQIETSYSITARIQQLSLVNFL